MKLERNFLLWIIVGFLALIALGTIPGFAATLVILLIVPIAPWQEFLRKYINGKIRIIAIIGLSILMFFSFFNSCTSDNHNVLKDTTTAATTESTNAFTVENTTTLSTDTSNIENQIPTETSSNITSTICSTDFTGDYYNDYVEFSIRKDSSYSLSFVEERKVVVNGIVDNTQFVVSSTEYSTICEDGVCTISFIISDYSSDYNGTIAIRCTQSSPRSVDYAVCINIPAFLTCGEMFIPINNLPTLDNLKFVDFDTKQEATIYTLPQVNNRYYGKPNRYAQVDLDGNGSVEFLVNYNDGASVAIICMDGETPIAYHTSPRSVLQLKTDGTMHGTFSASAGHIHRFTFSVSGMVDNEIMRYDYGENSGVESYTYYGEKITYDLFSALSRLQHEKENVHWTEIK